MFRTIWNIRSYFTEENDWELGGNMIFLSSKMILDLRKLTVAPWQPHQVFFKGYNRSGKRTRGGANRIQRYWEHMSSIAVTLKIRYVRTLYRSDFVFCNGFKHLRVNCIISGFYRGESSEFASGKFNMILLKSLQAQNNHSIFAFYQLCNNDPLKKKYLHLKG